MGLGEDAVKYADESGDTKERIIERTVLAHALYKAGKSEAAKSKHEEAEVLQGEYEPERRHLYPLWGYRYCDLLLREGRFEEVSARAGELKDWAQRSDRLMNFGMLDQVWGDLLTGRLCVSRGPLAESSPVLEQDFFS